MKLVVVSPVLRGELTEGPAITWAKRISVGKTHSGKGDGSRQSWRATWMKGFRLGVNHCATISATNAASRE